MLYLKLEEHSSVIANIESLNCMIVRKKKLEQILNF